MNLGGKYKLESGRERRGKEENFEEIRLNIYLLTSLVFDEKCEYTRAEYINLPWINYTEYPYTLIYIHIQLNSLPCVTVPHALSGALTAFAISSSRIACATSTAAIAVISPLSSYAGATSTTSPPMMFKPSSPARMVSSSRVLQPPGSGVPVAIHHPNPSISNQSLQLGYIS